MSNGYTISPADATNPAFNRMQAILVRSALRMMKKGMQPNAAWTPTKVRRVAEQITGNKYKRGEYDQPIEDISQLLEQM